jgi:hypothetical protein
MRASLHDLARHKPVEQVTDRGEALLDSRRRSLAAELLDVGGEEFEEALTRDRGAGG